MSPSQLRQLIVDWLDDNFHFGDAEVVMGDDDRSWTEQGVLDSLGFVQMIVYLEEQLGITIDRSKLSRENFDSMNMITRLLTAQIDQVQS